jgi:hypothetical protein
MADLRAVSVLRQALREPETAFARSLSWEALIRVAREAGMLGTLAYRIDERGLLTGVPRAPRTHLAAAISVCRAQQGAVRREVDEIRNVLVPLGIPLVLLKGSAYLLAGLPPSQGRVFSDIDILVPKHALSNVESKLMLAGFATSHHNAYDQRYYRRWMHELPPMQHVKRLTVIDVHYGIAPETGRIHPDPEALLASSVAVPGSRDVFTLSPADMILHSATHLFYNDEMTYAFRDLADIDALLRHFGDEPRFWTLLTARAESLGLTRSLYYALRFTSRFFATPIPESAFTDSELRSPEQPLRALMDSLLNHALLPAASLPGTRWSRRLLYLRAHWLRMPLPLLAYHLTVKALRREEPTVA